jgi:phosphoribosyl-ATP pyrophosphohydrolase
MTQTDYQILERLEAQIKARKQAQAGSSYTAQLLNAPVKKVAQKVAEEGAEVAMAAVSEGDEVLASEMADLLYHMLVLCEHRGVSFAQALAELARREGVSGLTEKAARED